MTIFQKSLLFALLCYVAVGCKTRSSLSETGGVIKNAKACGLVKETCTNKSSPQCAADLLKVVSSDADLRKAFYLSFFMGALDGEELVAMMKKNGILAILSKLGGANVQLEKTTNIFRNTCLWQW